MGKKIYEYQGNFSEYIMSVLTNNRKEIKAFLFGVILSVLVIFSFQYFTNYEVMKNLATQKNIRTSVPMEPFPEPQWRTPQTLDITTVTSTPFARFEIHKVKTESGAIVNDWLWTDERSHVNILVHLKNENKYLLFRQKKYGLERPYIAPVGGLFEPGETPEVCARRELLEETGLEAEKLVNLGRYRVQVNRGGGILHAFFAKNCIVSENHKKSDDYEKQDKLLLTRDELIKLSLDGEIGEAQWLATIALALIYDDYHNKL